MFVRIFEGNMARAYSLSEEDIGRPCTMSTELANCVARSQGEYLFFAIVREATQKMELQESEKMCN
jgi:hypothetical protein